MNLKKYLSLLKNWSSYFSVFLQSLLPVRLYQNPHEVFLLQMLQIIRKSLRALCEKCPNSEVFFLVRIFLYLDWIRWFTLQISDEKIRTRRNSKFGHFSCSGTFHNMFSSITERSKKIFESKYILLSSGSKEINFS